MAVAPLDILRVAKQVVQEHGVGAWLYAAMKYHEFNGKNDLHGAKTWRLIAEIIADWDDAKNATSLH